MLGDSPMGVELSNIFADNHGNDIQGFAADILNLISRRGQEFDSMLRQFHLKEESTNMLQMSTEETTTTTEPPTQEGISEALQRDIDVLLGSGPSDEQIKALLSILKGTLPEEVYSEVLAQLYSRTAECGNLMLKYDSEVTHYASW